MTPDGFRRLALRLPEATESSHMRHPDFRVRGKVFATLGYPDADWGMVKLTPVQQEAFCATEPRAFLPARGAWGRGGSTLVHLREARASRVQTALSVAWWNAAPPELAAKVEAVEARGKASPRRRPARTRRR